MVYWDTVIHYVQFIWWQRGLQPEASIMAPLMFSSCEKVLLFDGEGGGVLMDSCLLVIEFTQTWPLWPRLAHPQICSGIVFTDGCCLSQLAGVASWFHIGIATLRPRSMSQCGNGAAIWSHSAHGEDHIYLCSPLYWLCFRHLFIASCMICLFNRPEI